jgi:hypothetical protein
MKSIHIFLVVLIGMASSVSAGNGNGTPYCNCLNMDKTDLYAAGTAEWVSATQIKCTGEEGKCWELTYNGKFILTIYTEPPIIFDNHNNQDDPPLTPAEGQHGSGYIIYNFDPVEWRQQ